MAKKLAVSFYGDSGKFEARMVMTLKKNIEMTQAEAKRIIADQKLKSTRYTVSWEEGGEPDGYMVTPEPEREGKDG